MLSDQVNTIAQEKQGRILIVDDEEAVRQALTRLLRRQYDIEVAENGVKALEILEQQTFDLVISDMRMPEMNGAELLSQCFKRWPTMIRILLTGFSDLESAIKAVNEGNIYRYIAKPWDNDQLRQTIAEALELNRLRDTNSSLNAHIEVQNAELERLNRELHKKYEATLNRAGEAESQLQSAYRQLRQEFHAVILMLVHLIEVRLQQEIGSSERFARLTKTFAEFAGFDGHQIEDIYYAALLKDVGKVLLPDSILQKSLSEMDPVERKAYAKSPANAQSALMLLQPLHNAANLIRSHMELFNGKGFPDRLMADAIPRGARLLRIANDYVELQRKDNFLGQKLDESGALSYLKKMAGQRYDAQLLATFEQALEDSDAANINRVERLTVDELQPDMILASHFLSPAGVILLSEGTQLTAHHVEKLHALARQFDKHVITLSVLKALANDTPSAPTS